MAFISVPDCVQAQIIGHIDSCLTINNLYFRSTIGPRSSADLDALAVALRTWVIDTLAPLYNVGWTGTTLRVRGLTNAFGLIREAQLSLAAGAVTGEMMPNNVSMAVSFRTGVAGRSNHGRNYIPALSDSVVDGNNIDPTWAEDVRAAYEQLVFPTAVLPGGWIWVVVSRVLNNEPRAEGVFQEITEVILTDLIVDSMRSRLPGRGQ